MSGEILAAAEAKSIHDESASTSSSIMPWPKRDKNNNLITTA